MHSRKRWGPLSPRLRPSLSLAAARVRDESVPISCRIRTYEPYRTARRARGRRLVDELRGVRLARGALGGRRLERAARRGERPGRGLREPLALLLLLGLLRLGGL